jgi:hypothetical protein
MESISENIEKYIDWNQFIPPSLAGYESQLDTKERDTLNSLLYLEEKEYPW